MTTTVQLTGVLYKRERGSAVKFDWQGGREGGRGRAGALNSYRCWKQEVVGLETSVFTRNIVDKSPSPLCYFSDLLTFYYATGLPMSCTKVGLSLG